MAAFQKTFYMANWQQGKTNRTTLTTLQGRMQARSTGTWHKHRLLGSYCHRQRYTVKLKLSQYEEAQRVKAEEQRLYKNIVCVTSRPTIAFTCYKFDRDCHSQIGLHSHNRRCTMDSHSSTKSIIHETDRCQ